MKRSRFLLTGILGLSMLFGLITTVWAHESVTVGDYELEYGWLNEPAVSGQPNAVVINISSVDTSQAADIDSTGLVIEANFGGQTKVLSLQPLGEDTPGQFIAPITPMRPGIYTIHLSGMVGTTTFNTDVEPEEVQTTDVVQFPSEDSAGSKNGVDWLALCGVGLGLLGTGLGVFALLRKPSAK
jgi:hypothetical protein